MTSIREADVTDLEPTLRTMGKALAGAQMLWCKVPGGPSREELVDMTELVNHWIVACHKEMKNDKDDDR